VSEDHVAKYSKFILRDLARMFLGDVIGSGVARTVFAHRFDPTVVVKIEDGAGSFQNIREWSFWQDCAETKDVKRFLAPCCDISPCGTVLIQKKTSPIPPGKFPKVLPEFLTDVKPENFGMLEGRVVSHDYALHITRASIKVRKAKW
jgi:hypothetical protein